MVSRANGLGFGIKCVGVHRCHPEKLQQSSIFGMNHPPNKDNKSGLSLSFVGLGLKLKLFVIKKKKKVTFLT